MNCTVHLSQWRIHGLGTIEDQEDPWGNGSRRILEITVWGKVPKAVSTCNWALTPWGSSSQINTVQNLGLHWKTLHNLPDSLINPNTAGALAHNTPRLLFSKIVSDLDELAITNIFFPFYKKLTRNIHILWIPTESTFSHHKRRVRRSQTSCNTVCALLINFPSPSGAPLGQKI